MAPPMYSPAATVEEARENLLEGGGVVAPPVHARTKSVVLGSVLAGATLALLMAVAPAVSRHSGIQHIPSKHYISLATAELAKIGEEICEGKGLKRDDCEAISCCFFEDPQRGSWGVSKCRWGGPQEACPKEGGNQPVDRNGTDYDELAKIGEEICEGKGLKREDCEAIGCCFFDGGVGDDEEKWDKCWWDEASAKTCPKEGGNQPGGGDEEQPGGGDEEQPGGGDEEQPGGGDGGSDGDDYDLFETEGPYADHGNFGGTR